MASRKDEKEQRRAERVARQEAARVQERRRRTYGIVAGAVLVGAAVVAVVIALAAGGGGGGGDSESTQELKVAALPPPPEKEADLVKAAKAANCELKNPPVGDREHTTKPVKYKTNPPSSGSHDPVPTSDGAYAVAPAKEHLVHALEHGRIVIQWDPKLPERRLQQLKGLFDNDPYHLILTPNQTNMPYQVAVTAWGHIAGCKRMTDESFDVIRAFAQRYVDKAPEFVP